jgi:hypothetical protein
MWNETVSGGTPQRHERNEVAIEHGNVVDRTCTEEERAGR